MTRTVIFTVITMSLSALPSSAQQVTESANNTVMRISNADSKPAAACDYNRCALRFTLGWGNWRIVQGADNLKLGDVGFLTGFNLEPLVKDVPEAAQAAREFRSSYRRSSALIWGGAIVSTVAVGVAAGTHGNPAALTVGVGGLAAMAYGTWLHGKSFDLLSRSMWIYNRSLQR
jgi:hypothetical protein